jgi:hypothetical protein
MRLFPKFRFFLQFRQVVENHTKALLEIVAFAISVNGARGNFLGECLNVHIVVLQNIK